MEDILKIAAENPIIPVVKLERAEDATKLARALCKGGICCMEITFRTAAAKDAIKKVAEEVPEMLVGAGTVIGAGQVEDGWGEIYRKSGTFRRGCKKMSGAGCDLSSWLRDSQ